MSSSSSTSEDFGPLGRVAFALDGVLRTGAAVLVAAACYFRLDGYFSPPPTRVLAAPLFLAVDCKPLPGDALFVLFAPLRARPDFEGAAVEVGDGLPVAPYLEVVFDFSKTSMCSFN